MLFSDAPYVPGIQAAAKLRTEATKLQSRASMIWKSGGGNAMAQLLVTFWQDQKTRIDKPNGDFHDGVYMGAGNQDIRGLCYKVLAHHRLYPNAQDKADLKDFCDYFIMAAWSLDSARTKVASVEATPIYGEGRKGFSWDGKRVDFRLTFKDAAGKVVPSSHDNPLIGTLHRCLMSEAAPADQGKFIWVGQVTQDPMNWTLGSISTRTWGKNVAKFRYTADLPAIEVSVEYERLNAAGEVKPADPVEPPPKEPEAKAGKNGIAD